MYVPNRGDYVQAFDAATGRARCGNISRSSARRTFNGGNEPQPGDLGHHADRRRQRQPCSTPSTRAPASSCGRRASTRPTMRARATSGPIIAGRQGHHWPAMPTRCNARRLRRHGARRRHRPASCGARTRFRSPASPATRAGATCRWNSAGTSARGWCRASIRSSKRIYVGTSVTIPAAKFHSRRRRHAAPLSQLDARARPRDRQDRLVLPASRSITGISTIRSSGCSSTRAVTPDARQVPWINPRYAARRATQSRHGHSR